MSQKNSASAGIAGTTPSPGRPAFLTTRLSIMMFLEFAIWGSWSVVIAIHMNNLGFTGREISYVFGTTAFGAMLSPLIAGWVADRFMPNQLFTGLVHLASAVLMYVAWWQVEFAPLWTAIFFYAVLFMPTIALTNAIAFHHMKDSKDFGFIRVWGTIGWIAINWIIALYLRFWEGLQLDVQIGGVPLVVNWAGFSPEASRVGDALMFAAALAVVMGLYCFTLPNTPPSREAKNPYAFVEAFKLTENRNFAVLLIVSFIVAIELPFYYNLTPIYLSDTVSGIGLNPSTTGFVMTFGQVAEILLMLLLAPSIRYLGMRWTIFLGILAWPVRYGIFAIGEPTWLVIAAQSLHGLCFPFFFVAGMIAVERMSRRDIRASAQGLIVFATNGVGMLIGHFLSGQVHDYFELEDGGWDWSRIFLVPILVTLIPAVAFLVLFSERRFREQSRRVEHAEADHGGTART